MSKTIICALVCFLPLCFGYQQYLTFWSGGNYTGVSHTFTSKIPETSVDISQFLISAKSFRGSGYWQITSQPGYVGTKQAFLYADYDSGHAHHGPTVGASIRHYGPSETSIKSISVYKGRFIKDEEKVITDDAVSKFGFTPQAFFTTGFSNWTLYTGANFDGKATCIISTHENHFLTELPTSLWFINSVVKGCHSDSQIILR